MKYKSYNLDEIYGVSLEEYCKLQGITPEDLLKKTETDIEILSKRLRKLIWEEDRLLDPLVEEIERVVSKKRKHLKRLKDWYKNYIKN